jgi:hypothetical protein
MAILCTVIRGWYVGFALVTLGVNRRILILMRFRLLAATLVVLAIAGGARAQATFPSETKNAALRYWAAMAELREPIVDDDATMNLLSATFAGRAEWDEKKLGPLLDSNLDAIRTMQRATKLPECSWGFDYRHEERTPGWFIMRARRLAQLNAYEGIREMAHGDSQAAVNTWLAGLKFGQDVSRSGPVIVALVAGAMVLDCLQPLRDSARRGKLSEEERKELSALVKAMPEDGFDWGLAWGVECATGEQSLEELQTSSNPKALYEKYGFSAPKRGLPPTTVEIRAYEEYMLAAQAALREPPGKARARVDNLESKMRRLGEPEQLQATSFRQSNDARVQVATQREELMQALASK